ncbi:F-box domain-containing protein [Mycena indigotica]|uniref:F-box domain-containing protein n=1 Tax=Mycena indigotica TaxID=2126181 RepID=A0A8H6SD44_9AGAR|nr:F-box domain-containing protein [Mycena indigotica]KAF7295675.1 F-box domain-containing protein [Mycena indigotica]
MDAHHLPAYRLLLKEVEEDIANAQAHLNALESKRAEICQRLEAYKYPVLSLPNEIITEIFSQYLPEYPSCPPLTGPGSPTHLLGIYRLWRKIALKSPTLWRALEMDIENADAELANSWLQRSGSSFLSLNFDFEPFGPQHDGTPLLETILAHRKRWEYIHFRVASSYDAEIACISGEAPALVEADIASWGSDADWEAEPGPTSISFHNAPRLRSICVGDVRFTPQSIPWAQLTTVVLYYVAMTACIPVLAQAESLRYCRLVFKDISGVSQPQGVPLTLPRVEILVLLDPFRPHDPDSENNVLANLTLPSLQKLEISGCLLPYDNQNSVEAIRSLISRSACSLRHLRADIGFYTVADWAAAFPNIHVFHSTHSVIYNGTIWKLDDYWEEPDESGSLDSETI